MRDGAWLRVRDNPAGQAGVKDKKMAYSDTHVEPAGLLGAHSLPEDLYRAGLAYATGTGTEINLVEAHKWFNLAAARGHEEAKQQRQEMADMLSSEEVKIALQAARDWLKLAH